MTKIVMQTHTKKEKNESNNPRIPEHLGSLPVFSGVRDIQSCVLSSSVFLFVF